MARYELNDEHNGIEIYFDSMPSDEVREKLRENGWRWFRAKKCWYTRRSDQALKLAEEIHKQCQNKIQKECRTPNLTITENQLYGSFTSVSPRM